MVDKRHGAPRGMLVNDASRRQVEIDGRRVTVVQAFPIYRTPREMRRSRNKRTRL